MDHVPIPNAIDLYILSRFCFAIDIIMCCSENCANCVCKHVAMCVWMWPRACPCVCEYLLAPTMPCISLVWSTAARCVELPEAHDQRGRYLSHYYRNIYTVNVYARLCWKSNIMRLQTLVIYVRSHQD